MYDRVVVTVYRVDVVQLQMYILLALEDDVTLVFMNDQLRRLFTCEISMISVELEERAKRVPHEMCWEGRGVVWRGKNGPVSVCSHTYWSNHSGF